MQGQFFGAEDRAFRANSCTEIDSGLGAACGMTKYAENGLFVFITFTVRPISVSLYFF